MDNWAWHNGVRGLTLNFDVLRSKGVSPSFLKRWEQGTGLGGAEVEPRDHQNHPSMVKYSGWAEREWSRLDALGKVTFFPKDAPKPKYLNVNPCGLILKARPEAADTDDEIHRFKAR